MWCWSRENGIWQDGKKENGYNNDTDGVTGNADDYDDDEE